MNRCGRGKIGITIQIVALVILLCLPYLPLLANALTVHGRPRHCSMDHRICGCSPERISSRTCCCFRNMKSGKTPIKHGLFDWRTKAHNHCELNHHNPPVSYELSSLPCVSDPQMISHTTSEMKYLLSIRGTLPTHRAVPHNQLKRRHSYIRPSLEPHTPPPKKSIFV
jgi:hypothetical protein